MGDSGILLTGWRQSPSEAIAAELAQCIAGNQEHPSRELMLGAPGTMLAALAMHDFTREERWAELFRRSAAALWRTLEEDPASGAALWTQDFPGMRSKLTGAVHGFAGNVLPIIRGRELLPEAEWKQRLQCITRTIELTASREDTLANWPQSQGEPRPGRTALLV